MKVAAILILSFICISKGSQCQNNHAKNSGIAETKIYVQFLKDDTLVKMKNKFKIFVCNGDDSINIPVKKSFLVLPTLKKVSGYYIIFKYKKYLLKFAGITKRMILAGQTVTWKFGIDNHPFNDSLGLLTNDEYKSDKDIRQIQYFQIDPNDFGDGIQFVRKIK